MDGRTSSKSEEQEMNEEEKLENVIMKTKGTGERCDDGIKNN